MTVPVYSIETGVNLENITNTELSSSLDIDDYINDLMKQTITLTNIGTGVSTAVSGSSTQTSSLSGLYNPSVHTQSIWPNGTNQTSLDLEKELFEKTIAKVVKREVDPILSRLAILESPSPAVLEKFEALKMAYDHYKILEGLMFSELEKSKSG